MGWRGFTRQVIAASRRAQRDAAVARRRSERDAHRQQRELARERKDWERMAAQQRAVAEVAFFRNAVDVLLSVHKECSTQMDWGAAARARAPIVPSYANTKESSAVAIAAAYKPGFFARLFNQEAKHRAQLASDIEDARARDQQRFQRLQDEHKTAHEEWAWQQQLATGVLAGDIQAYETAINYFEPLAELEEQGCRTQFGTTDPWYVAIDLLAKDDSIVPTEEKSLAASGKLSSKKMAAGKQRELYQDYVCGCALRCGREMLALLPVQFVIVHLSIVLLNKSTGHEEPTTVLSVAFSRAGMGRLNVDELDPSDAMANFLHRMGFKKSSGFARVDAIRADELSPQRMAVQ